MHFFWTLIVFFITLTGTDFRIAHAEVNKNIHNRLIHEKSPYLIQHAHNPVDWYPWGEEAFDKAKKEDKPIFLSIGYSTCHWCHVMEEESFSNADIAMFLNQNFVSIKVDREERPDIDNVYMNAVQKMTGSGGWPLNVFLNHEKEPFAGGTYFPPVERFGKPSFPMLLETIADGWKTNRKNIDASGAKIRKEIESQNAEFSAQNVVLDKDTLKKAYQRFKWQFDPTLGGFGSAPKFPRAHILSFIMRYAKRTQEEYASEIVNKTLEMISRGGIRDHLGGGFHRYSTDARWFLPHFEKMLYDQAILSKAFLEAYQITGNESYAEIAKEIFEYVLRDMTSPRGAFYSAEDADSARNPDKPHQKTEGAFYVWKMSDLNKTLTTEEAEVFVHHYGVVSGGNIDKDPHEQFDQENILYIDQTVAETAEFFDRPVQEVQELLSKSREKLLALRNTRKRPHLDDKILTDWNGLMISSLAFGSRVLNEPRYLEHAKEAANFIMKRLKGRKGRLMHRYRDGEVAIKGFIEDYAFFTHGLIDLYEATFDPVYLQEALHLLNQMFELFWDHESGGFWFSGTDNEVLISATKELYDGAIPSGNSVATLSLLRAARLTSDEKYQIWANSNFEAFSEAVSKYPSRFPQMLIALDFAIGPSKEIVIAGKPDDKMTIEFTREVFEHFLPNKVVAFHPPKGKTKKQIESLAPFVKFQNPLKGKPTVYVCENHVCKLPTSELNQLRELLLK